MIGRVVRLLFLPWVGFVVFCLVLTGASLGVVICGDLVAVLVFGFGLVAL